MNEQKLIVFLTALGWEPYYNSWIKTSWIKDGAPYDRMACSGWDVWEAFKKENDFRWYPNEEAFLKVHIKEDGQPNCL